MIAKHLLISGRVQGVFYRDSTRRKAAQLGVSGWVRNLPDGRVEAVAQGEAETVDRLVTWCHEGPRWARVDSVEAVEVELDEGLTRFEVRY